MEENVINTNLKEDNTLEIYYGNMLLCCVNNGSTNEDFIEDILYGMGYHGKQDGTLIPLNK
jgi:hypothetical protein